MIPVWKYRINEWESFLSERTLGPLKEGTGVYFGLRLIKSVTGKTWAFCPEVMYATQLYEHNIPTNILSKGV